MPGPLNKSRTPGVAEKPNKRGAAKLARRQAGFSKPNDKTAAGFHMPGSQNRKK